MPDHVHTRPEVVSPEKEKSAEAPKGSNRRTFLGQAGAAAAVFAGALASPAVAKEEGQSNTGNIDEFEPGNPTQDRPVKAMRLRVSEAVHDQKLHAINVNNGDDALYADRAGTYTKGLAHDAYGRVTPESYASLKKALASGWFADFENIILGGSRTLNGPQGGLMYDLEALDYVTFDSHVLAATFRPNDGKSEVLPDMVSSADQGAR